MAHPLSLDQIPMIHARRRDETQVSERRLIRAAQRGSEEAIARLVESHWRSAYATALAVLGDAGRAEDTAQEAMLAAVSKLRDFDSSRPFAPWLHRIVTNRALDSLRGQRRRPETVLIDQVESVGRDATPDLSLDLLAALQELEPRDRAIVVLRHVAGFSSHEIGQIVGASPDAVRSALGRALERLRRSLEPTTIGTKHE